MKKAKEEPWLYDVGGHVLLLAADNPDYTPDIVLSLEGSCNVLRTMAAPLFVDIAWSEHETCNYVDLGISDNGLAGGAEGTIAGWI
jgi:hypothetical protein